MSKLGPSQYDCDNMEIGDIVAVRKPHLLYRIIRKYFLKDKLKIRVRKSLEKDIGYEEYYQEDCTLIYGFENACMQQFNNVVPFCLSGSTCLKKFGTLKQLSVGLYNSQLVFRSGWKLTLPTSYFSDAINKNKLLLNKIEDNRKVTEAIKFEKYKGIYFRDFMKSKGLLGWNACYCVICGRPVTFNFGDDSIKILNGCTCGCTKYDRETLSYDEFALWYANQVVNPLIKKKYDEYWFSGK